jgi:hypothetical protein
MKNLFLFIVAISILFVMGCQENAITDPLFTDSPEVQAVTNVTAEKNLPQDYKDYPDIIKFQRVVNLAHSPNTYFIVAGTIKVDHKILNPASNPVNGPYRVTVSLSIDAEMKDMEYGSDIWTIKENSTNTVYLTEGETTSLVKYFKVKGRSDGMLLACNFEVTLDRVALQGMWITFARVHSANNVAQ